MGTTRLVSLIDAHNRNPLDAAGLTKAGLLRKQNRSSSLALMQRNYSPIGTDSASGICSPLPPFARIRQTRVSGSYCLIIVAGEPKTTQ
jgi:hypothetical protein